VPASRLVLSPVPASRRPPAWNHRDSSVVDPLTTPRVSGLHLQFGADARSEVVASWHSLLPMRRARVLLGRPDGGFERTVPAQTVSYTDSKSGQVVYAHHARLERLHADKDYVYAVVHEGAEAEFGSFRTGPSGRSRFTFTSSGDQGTPTTGKRYTPPPGVTIPRPPYVNDNLGSPAAGTSPWAWSGCSRCSTCSTVTCATRTSRSPGSGPGPTSGRTTAAAPGTGRGCRQRRGDPRGAGAGLRVQVAAHHLDLAVTPGELHHRDLVGPRERVDPTPEPGPDLLQDRRRGDRQPQVPGHERDDLPPNLQGRHIPVEIDPIQTLDVQPDVTLEQIIHRHLAAAIPQRDPNRPAQASPAPRRSEAQPHWMSVEVLLDGLV
jgi:hypothetical protein